MNYGRYHFSDPSVRLIEERDIPAIINLFKLNYGENYRYSQFYDESWVKKGIYNDNVISLVIEVENKLVAAGSLVLDIESYKDQVGEVGRVVVHPDFHGRALGGRIINAIIEISDEMVEFAFGTARTAKVIPQKLMGNSNFAPIGLYPSYFKPTEHRENVIIYAKLSSLGRELRSTEKPQMIPEAASLAKHSLKKLDLQTNFSISEDCSVYSLDSSVIVEPIERRLFPKLLGIEHGRLVRPMLFGSVSLEHGISALSRKGANYLTVLDENKDPKGAIGYTVDWANRWVKGIELIAESEEYFGALCAAFARTAEHELMAEGIEVNVSAYDARIQKTFYELGFRPVAYAPAMVFHGTKRLDVVKMLKLNVPYAPGEMKLTEPAREVVSLVEKHFLP